jgi:acyl carrier protein
MPNPFVSEARVQDETRAAVAKSLRKDAASVPLDASIVDDLGGASLDFLDITFRLEQAFGVRLAHTTILDHVDETFGEGKAIDAQGRLTADAATVLRLRLGDDPTLVAGMFADEVPRLVTPGTLASGVREILDRLPAACTHCRATAWASPDGAKVKCGACGKDAAYPYGDTLARDWLRVVAREKSLFAA